jgi:hypothetical protein
MIDTQREFTALFRRFGVFSTLFLSMRRQYQTLILLAISFGHTVSSGSMFTDWHRR